MSRVIIAGCRDFNNYEFLKKAVLYYTQNLKDIEVVSGKCRGVDELGERLAYEMGWKVKGFPPDWSLGKKAGPLRNEEMAHYGEYLIAFWDEKSKGTRSMIRCMNKLGKPVKIIKIKE